MTLLTDPGALGLVGDIGGTHARFAITDHSDGKTGIREPLVLDAVEFPSIEAAAEAYLARIGRPPNLQAAVLACAGPIAQGRVRFVNSRWGTSENDFAAKLNLPAVRLINDLAAVAWAVPLLGAKDLRALGRPVQTPLSGSIAILGVGTGLNASAFIPSESGEIVLGGEFGHTGFAPADALETDLWRIVGARYGRVSNERVLSGPGLLNVYQALCSLAGVPAPAATPADISRRAEAGEEPAARAVARFCSIMGSVAGDVALAFGAAGGVLIAGGVAQTMLNELDRGTFRQRFEAKGRLSANQLPIPTAVIVHQVPALLGAARALTVLHRHRAHPAEQPG